tara:strand:+ start:457 stop:792 length:336 start_codon:yes stop_codon:yes gene_type:complete
MNPSDKYEQIKDIKRLNPVEQEAMVLHHDQQIKDIAAHLLELKQSLTIEFKQPTKICGPNLEEVLNAAGFYRKKEWVGLTDEDWATVKGMQLSYIDQGVAWAAAKLKEKNT